MGAALAAGTWFDDARKTDFLAAAEVAALWDAGWPVFTESRALRWFMAREWAGPAEGWGRVPTGVASLDLARSLPPGADCPRWAGGRRWSWAADGWSLLLPCFDARGELVALRARWTGTELSPNHGEGAYPEGPADPDDPSTYLDRPPPGGWGDGPAWLETKPPFGEAEMAPAGRGATAGTVYADPVGRWILRHGADAETGGWPSPEDAPGLRWDGRVVIVEGGADWLHCATEPGRVKTPGDGWGWTPAVMGVWPGCRFGAELAGRLSSAELAAVLVRDDALAEKVCSELAAAGVRVGRHG